MKNLKGMTGSIERRTASERVRLFVSTMIRPLAIGLLFFAAAAVTETARGEAASAAGKPKFTSSRLTGNNFAMEWLGNGSLQVAENMNGPWVTIKDAKSPFAAGREVKSRFYRLIDNSVALGSEVITALDDRTVQILFDRELSASALDAANYTISNDAGGNVRVLAAKFGTTQNVVELATTPQTSVDYQLTINNLQDRAGQPIYFDGRDFSGNPKGAVVSAGATSSTRVIVVYNEPMADNALAPQHYSIKDASGNSLAVTDVNFDGPLTMVVVLSTVPQANVLYTVTVTNVTDLLGDPLATTTRSAPFLGVTAPGLLRAFPTDATHITLTFSGPMGESALAASSFLIEQLDSANAVVGKLGILSARFVGDGKTIVELTTQPQKDARYRLSTTPGLTDPDANVLPVASAPFDGINGQPTISLVAAVGPTALLVTFNVPMSDDVLSPAAYKISQLGDPTKLLKVLNVVFVGTERRIVQLTTEPQANVNYVIEKLVATGVSGTPLVLPATTATAVNTVTGNVGPSGTPADSAAPRVVGAASLDNTHLIVAFSEPMSASAIQPEHYVIVQENVNPEAGYLRVSAASFYNQNPSTVVLTTSSQNELTYRVTVVNATDLSGIALAPKVIANGVLVDPTSVTFPGTPPIGTIDTDGDGLPDSVEMRGWIVTVHNVDGTVATRGVTSDPSVADTDGDGLNDAQEMNLGFDPRNVDTDGDQLSDWAEFNEIYSNGLDQDTDHDGLDDFLEFTFFHTSPLFVDSDGDQIADGDEIVGNRNPLVADLPRPEISIGAVNLELDVKFTETNAQERRDLETRAVTSSLASSQSATYTRSDTVALEAHLEAGYEPGEGGRGKGFVNGGLSVGYTFQQTAESEAATQQSYERSLSTDKEVTKGFTVEREVQGAVMQVAVNLRNVSSVAYRVKNLQVTAFIQDPLDHNRLTPVATLLPDKEPDDGFTLGPLVSDRGPFIFSNTTIVPSLVETLMANSSGLVFRISNYDIIDERGRNFAFSSQEIIERTARLVIDYGGASSLRAQVSGEAFDEIQPGDETEIHRVATSGGRAIADTNGDTKVDRYAREIFNASGESLGIDYNGDGLVDAADDSYEGDTIVVFDGAGKPVGIGLHQAMAAVGLTHYDEAVTPTVALTEDEVLNSYSTFVVNGREKVYRIRAISNDSSNRKFWEILTPFGVDHITDLNDLILTPNTPVSLNFVQDLDGDGLTADVEYFLRTSDSDLPVSATDPAPRGRDTDKDGLDDRFEALIGWTVTTPQSTYKVWSSPKRPDSNFDGLSDAFTAPAGWNDLNGNHLRDRINEVFTVPGVPTDWVLDPIRRDTDGDGIDDADELAGFTITPITGAAPYTRKTSPLNPDTDGDTFSDGFERLVGLDPTDPNDIDSDGDGLPDPVEDAGWMVETIGLSTVGFQQGPVTAVLRKPSKNSVDSDGDGLTDFEEFFLKTNPLSKDTDGDGIEDLIELKGFSLPHKVGDEDLGIIKTDVLDADTDNDKRSDGAEAELIDVELQRWIVRVDGQTPYRVFSNPLIADADFDSVVDGDEFLVDPLNSRRHTDPNNGNTDGDGRDDGVEKAAGTNPLAVDVRVTVIAESITTSGAGQFNFALNVRKPDAAGVGGLSATPTVVYANDSGNSRRIGKVKFDHDGIYCANVYYRWYDGSGAHETDKEPDVCGNFGFEPIYDPGLKGVPAGATFEVLFSVIAGCCGNGGRETDPVQQFIYDPTKTSMAKFRSSGILTSVGPLEFLGIETPVPIVEELPIADRFLDFGLAAGERFSIEGFVTGITPTKTETVKFGGLEGSKAFQESSSETPTQIRPIFSLTEVQDKFLEEFYFEGVVNGITVKIKFFYLIE